MKTTKLLLLLLILSMCLNACSFSIPAADSITTEADITFTDDSSASSLTAKEEITSVSETKASQSTESSTDETTADAGTTEISIRETTEAISADLSDNNLNETQNTAYTEATTAEITTAVAEPVSNKNDSDEKTDASSGDKSEEEHTTQSASFCTVTIECKTVYNNYDSLKDEKKKFIPSDGIILKNAKCEILEGDTAFSVLKRVCENNTCSMNCSYCKDGGIRIEYNYTPAFNNYYIEGIHQLYEKDCGYLSGWMYSVNGVFPTTGISTCEIKDGDAISILYTCDMGEDIGNLF